MKAKLVAGLVAIALGGFTSCGNILEENRVINNVAQNGTGELRINLNQDPSVNVISKAGSFDGSKVTLSEAEIDEFDIKVSDVTGLDGKYKDIKAKTATASAGEHTITATYGNMTENFAFDTPCFSGTQNVTVKANEAVTGDVTCKLSNSIIVIDAAALNTFKTDATITNIVAIIGEVTKDSDLTSGTSLIETGGALKTGTLYVKPELTDAKIVLDGYLTKDTSRKFRAIADIKSGTNAGAGNKYNVKYTFSSSSQGSLKINVDVNGVVTQQDISVNINPYE